MERLSQARFWGGVAQTTRNRDRAFGTSPCLSQRFRMGAFAAWMPAVAPLAVQSPLDGLRVGIESGIDWANPIPQGPKTNGQSCAPSTGSSTVGLNGAVSPNNPNNNGLPVGAPPVRVRD